MGMMGYPNCHSHKLLLKGNHLKHPFLTFPSLKDYLLLHISKATYTDAVLNKVLQFTKQDWPEKSDSDLEPFRSRENELSIENNCFTGELELLCLQSSGKLF